MSCAAAFPANVRSKTTARRNENLLKGPLVQSDFTALEADHNLILLALSSEEFLNSCSACFPIE
jgi:hypothetical protein